MTDNASQSVLDSLKNVEVVEQPQEELVAAAEELKEAPPTFDPIQAASHIFETYFPVYCRQLDKLSRKQIVRVTKAVMGIPLEDGVKPNVKDEEELQAYYIAERLLQSKMILIHHSLTERQRELEEKQKTEKKEEVVS